MNERVVLVAIRYLAIAVALLHTSLGAKPTLRVVYRLDDVDNKNELECFVGGFVQSGATFTFKEPETEAVAVETDSVMERSFMFTIHPSNESLVTCTIGSEESDSVMVAAIPQYTAGVQTIRQYVYSDSERVDIECPFQFGRLRELYEFSWHGVTSDGLRGPITNGSRGLYWLAEEVNRTLHVNISAAGDLRSFECVGIVQTCTGSTSCTTWRRNSPTITIINNITRPSIVESPANVVVNQSTSYTAIFNCSATSSGELTIEWICSDSTDCGSIIDDDSADGYVTSTYGIARASASLSITCVVNQSLASFILEESDIETRLPHTELLRRIAELTVILPPTIAATTQPDSQQPGTEGSSSANPSSENTNPNNQLIIIILAIVLVFIIITIVILGASMFYIFRYHYRNGESCLGQRLRQTFSCCSVKRDPLYAIPTDISESATEGNHDTQQVPQREVTIAMAHPINYQTKMLMQGNTAYGTDIAIAPEIAAERNIAYGHMSYDKKAASENSGTIGHQLLQHFDTNEVEMEHLINQQDELGSTTDVTSSTTYSAIFPCPITMNLSGTGVETLV